MQKNVELIWAATFANNYQKTAAIFGGSDNSSYLCTVNKLKGR